MIRSTGKRNHTGHRVGEWHGRAKLTDAQVRQIRLKYRPNVVGYKTLADEYGVHPSTIREIVSYAIRGSA